MYALLFEGIETCLFDFCDAVGDGCEGILACLVGGGDAVAHVSDAVSYMTQAVLVYFGLECCERVRYADGVGNPGAVCHAGAIGDTRCFCLGETVGLHLLDAAQAVENMLLPGLEFGLLFFLQGVLLYLVELALRNKKAEQQKEHDDENDDVLLFAVAVFFLCLGGLDFFILAHNVVYL